MLLCPNCRTPLPEPLSNCLQCQWEPKATDGVLRFLSTAEEQSIQHQNYKSIYDFFANKNKDKPSLSDKYVKHLARRFAYNIGDIRGKNVCDVGAGRGYFIKEALTRGASSLTAIDITDTFLMEMAKNSQLRCVQANAENIPFKDEFDVLTATDVLEHVLNVGNFMIAANWALKTGGRIAIRVPLRENLKFYSNYFGMPVAYSHLRTYNRALLKDTLEHYNFAVDNFYYDGFRSAELQPWAMREPIMRRIIAALRRRYPDEDDVTTIPPWLGSLFMRPIEITVVATKIADMQIRNVFEGY